MNGTNDIAVSAEKTNNRKAPFDHSTILQALKGDLKSAEVLKKEWDAKIKAWIREDEGDPYGNEVKGKSSIVSRDIKRQREWQHATLVDPFVSNNKIIKTYPITAEDALAARQNELLLNTQFCRQFDRYNFMTKLVKVMSREGTAVIQTGWDYEDEEVEVEIEKPILMPNGQYRIVKEKTTELKILKNKPTARICRNEDIYLDPTCMDDIDSAQFVIYRYESDLSTLRQDGRYKNLDKVANEANGRDVDFRPQDQTIFRFKDDPRKKLVVYEYWGNYDVNNDGIAEAIVCTWVGSTIIRLQDNPYPDERPPFIVVPFSSVPFQLHGESNAEMVGDNQKIKTAIIRGMIDNMAQSTNAQIGVKKGALDALNKKKFVNGQPFEFNGSANDFWFGQFNALPKSAFDMLGLMNNEIESLTGVKSFSGGITAGSLGATATGARGALDATATRRLNLVRGIAENGIKKLIRKWMSYNAVFLSEEEVVRVTNEQFVPIRRDDLQGNVDLDIEISTAEDNASKSQELSFLLQTVGPNEDPEIRKELMAQVMELMRMPDQARKLREYQPKPDPLQQLQAQKLQAEIDQIRAETANLQAMAGENQIDQKLKSAKAEVELAKARKLSSESDNLDLQYLKDDNGISLHEDMQRSEQAHNQAMASKAADHMHERLMSGLSHGRSVAAENNKADSTALLAMLSHKHKMAELAKSNSNKGK